MNKSISGIVLILAIISGCSIEFKDLTPTEQPIWTKDCAGGVSNETWPWRIPSAEFLWESTRNDQLKLREEYHFGYFFVLESKSKLTKVDKAVVVIDGVDFEMGQEGNLYYYNHQDRCKTEYTYYYRIDYATVTKLKTHYIYSENEPAISKAPFYFGNMLIFAECMKPKKPNNCASLLQLYDAEEEFHYINVYVMNTK